jgi:hypothetical protein
LLLTAKVSGGKLAAKITRSGFHTIISHGIFRSAVELANISAAGRQVEIKQMLEGNGRTYLSISGTLD